MCLLLLVASAWAGEKKPVTKLQIGVKKRIPAEDCPIKTRNGDNLHMVNTSLVATPSTNEQTLVGDFQHYTGTLYEDGSEFDSSIPRYFTIGSVQDGLRAYSITVQGSAIDLPAGNRQGDQGLGPGTGEFSDQDTSCKMGGGGLVEG